MDDGAAEPEEGPFDDSQFQVGDVVPARLMDIERPLYSKSPNPINHYLDSTPPVVAKRSYKTCKRNIEKTNKLSPKINRFAEI